MTSKSHKTRSFRPSPALVIACVALFAALTGSAIAAGVGKNTVRSPQIVNGTIRTVDLRDNAVATGKIAPNAVAAGKIAPDAVDTTEIVENGVESSDVAPDSLTAGDLAPASVASSEVADQSLSADDLGPNSVGSSELQAGSVRANDLGPIVAVSNSTTINTGANASVSVNCPAGTVAISGGNTAGDYRVALTGAQRSGNGWIAHAHNYAPSNTSLTVYAYCLSA
ncbi:MAG TPA: hypothetical protein VG898_01580 [Solirubrobacterales bacterium]|nr:hypothetical protein [Solirubrobacterales bacterium]